MNALRIAAVALALMALPGCASDADVDELPGPVVLEPLPKLELPGTTASPAGMYGWEGGPGGTRGMHLVDGDRLVTSISFSVGPGCLTPSADQAPHAVRVAGFPGIAVEPYLPPVSFGGGYDDATTRAHQLEIGDRFLCAFVTWHADTTPIERDAALRVLQTIRAQPSGPNAVRITFMLLHGWDTG